jgi:hypothetical protein
MATVVKVEYSELSVVCSVVKQKLLGLSKFLAKKGTDT